MVEKKRNLIELLVTNCQRALPAKFQFIILCRVQKTDVPKPARPYCITYSSLR